MKAMSVVVDPDVGLKITLFGFKGERCVASSDGRGAIFQTAAEEKCFCMYVSREEE